MSEIKNCSTCIENDEYVCTYKCNKHSHWKGCPNNRQCYPMVCELYRKDCKFGRVECRECQG